MNKKTLITLLFSLALPASLFAEVKQQYPQKIDDYLTLSNVIRNDTVTTVEITVTNIANLDAAQKEDLKKDIVDRFIVEVCNDQRILDAIKTGHLIQTNFRKENNDLLTSVPINQSLCAAK